MPRPSSTLKRILLAGGAVTLLFLAGWIALNAALVTAAETALSELFLAPVRIESARAGWPPGRVSFADVRVGEDAELSAERLVVEARVLPLLRGELQEAKLELHTPTIQLRSLPEASARRRRVLRNLSGAATDGLRVESVKVDHARIVRGSTKVFLAPFELRGIDVARPSDGSLWIEADVASGAGAGSVAIEVSSHGADASLSIEAEAIDVSLEEALKSSDEHMRGTLNGRFAYAGSWSATEPTEVFTLTTTILDFEVERESKSFSLSRLRVDDLRIDTSQREIRVETIDAADGVFSPDFMDTAASEAVVDPWNVRVANADVTDLRVDSTPPLAIMALRLREVGTPWKTGAFELDARIGSGHVRLAAERRDANAPGTATLAVDALSVADVIAEAASPARISRGLLDLRVDLSGPPGIQGEGQLRLRDVAGHIDTPHGKRQLLELTDLHVDLQRFSLAPLRLWLRTAQIIEPRVWVRRSTSGFELEKLWAEKSSRAAPSWVQEVLASVTQWAGASPTPDVRPGEVGVRLTDGEVLLVDDTLQPPMTIEFSTLNALIGGPAGPAGPVDLELEARSDTVGSIWLRGRTGPGRTTAEGAVGPVSLSEFGGYLKEGIGFAVTAGSIDLSFNARVEPQPAMNIRLELDGIGLARSARGDPLGPMLGAPLPAVVEELQGASGQGRLDVTLHGRHDRPNYGFLEALPEALKRAISEATQS